VIIDDFDLFCVCVSPEEANSPLVIDSNAVLAFPVVFKPLKAISRQGGQICQVHACGQRQKFSASRALNIQGQLFRTVSLKDSLSLGVAKAYDHVAIISCGVINARQSCRAGTLSPLSTTMMSSLRLEPSVSRCFNRLGLPSRLPSSSADDRMAQSELQSSMIRTAISGYFPDRSHPYRPDVLLTCSVR
jgi:hypothetical protein